MSQPPYHHAMPLRTRFAPSPTGELHLGHLYSAKVARDLAKSEEGGQFLLRFEDIDHTRCQPRFEQSIQDDLQWMGQPWDGTILRQSTRTRAYEEALAELKSRSLVYPCFCTRKEILAELEAAAAAPHHTGELHYPGTCRSLHPDECAAKIASGESHCWRIDARSTAACCGPLDFLDLVHGTQHVDPKSIGDVVLARKDIGVAYHLAVVIDDAFQQITHVTRGEDLLAFTPIHRVLQHLLHLPTPTYLHHRLIRDEAGQRLAKRNAPLTLRHLREQGRSRDEILSLLPWDPEP